MAHIHVCKNRTSPDDWLRPNKKDKTGGGQKRDKNANLYAKLIVGPISPRSRYGNKNVAYIHLGSFFLFVATFGAGF